MPNEQKKKYAYENRGGGELGGEKAPEGNKTMNEALRNPRSRDTLDLDKAGMSLGDKSPGDLLREAHKKRQLERLEQRRGGRQQ